jgi:acyl carrier protein phosphodiesterase
MNYLAHARHLLDNPYALAGSALPDWLRILDRKNRFRAHTVPAADDDDPRTHAVVAGLSAHFDDDAWFHVHPAFTSLLDDTTLRLRARAPGVRASVLAHILIEMLLDAELMRRDPTALDRYVDALTRIDVHFLTEMSARHLPRAPTRLAELVAYFAANPFMADYETDDGVFARLAGLSSRVGLGDLPRVLLAEIGPARARVAALADPLLGVDGA